MDLNSCREYCRSFPQPSQPFYRARDENGFGIFNCKDRAVALRKDTRKVRGKQHMSQHLSSCYILMLYLHWENNTCFVDVGCSLLTFRCSHTTKLRSGWIMQSTQQIPVRSSPSKNTSGGTPALLLSGCRPLVDCMAPMVDLCQFDVLLGWFLPNKFTQKGPLWPFTIREKLRPIFQF